MMKKHHTPTSPWLGKDWNKIWNTFTTVLLVSFVLLFLIVGSFLPIIGVPCQVILLYTALFIISHFWDRL
jgi:hypothetical protein